METDFVYHASETSNIPKFKLRSFWYSPTLPNSGRFGKKDDIPPDWIEHRVVYACSHDKIPFYFFPSQLPRLRYHTNILQKYENHFSMFDFKYDLEYFIIIDANYQNTVFNHEFSIYTFDKSKFEPVSTTEFICKQDISPLSEERCSLNLDQLHQYNHDLFFVKNFKSFVQKMKKENLITTAQNI